MMLTLTDTCHCRLQSFRDASETESDCFGDDNLLWLCTAYNVEKTLKQDNKKCCWTHT